MLAAVRKNTENAKNHTGYMQLLTEVSGAAGTSRRSELLNSDFMGAIVDVREHDIPYHVRVCIDLSLFCGNWYAVTSSIVRIPLCWRSTLKPRSFR